MKKSIRILAVVMFLAGLGLTSAAEIARASYCCSGDGTWCRRNAGICCSADAISCTMFKCQA
jgi:hypothetical protein